MNQKRHVRIVASGEPWSLPTPLGKRRDLRDTKVSDIATEIASDNFVLRIPFIPLSHATTIAFGVINST